MFSAQADALPESLSRDDEGDGVRLLQERLAFLGFLDDEADGKYGKNTQNAVEDYQEHLVARGLSWISATGTATPVTQGYLFDETQSTYMQDLAQGDESDEVLRLERRLRTLGYLDDDPDDVFDNYTDSVVRAFQSAAELEATGVADRATFDALFSADAPVAERFVAHDIYAGDTGDAVLAVQKVLTQYGMLAAEPDGAVRLGHGGGAGALLRTTCSKTASPFAELFAMYDGVFCRGAGGAGERRTSSCLRGNAVERGSIPATRCCACSGGCTRCTTSPRASSTARSAQRRRTAIREFQANNRLEATGVADEATQRALYSADRHRQEHQVQAGGEHRRPARVRLRPQLLRRIRVEHAI